YSYEVSQQSLPNVVFFGSWIGGDRDGNPYVTSQATSAALEMARQTILDHYLTTIRELIQNLSLSAHQILISQELQKMCNAYTARFSDDAYLNLQAEGETYRRYLAAIFRRLRYSLEEPTHEHAYLNAEEFLTDLRLLRDSLLMNKGEQLAQQWVDPL